MSRGDRSNASRGIEEGKRRKAKHEKAREILLFCKFRDSHLKETLKESGMLN
jgi:hypothetical protein